MCPTEKCLPGGGAHGSRPTGRYVEPGVGDGVLQWGEAAIRFLFFGDGFPRQCSHWLGMTGSTAALHAMRAMHAASALSYTGAGEGYTVRRCGGGSWFLGICALGLGLGILIAAVFPVGCLMFLVAFLLIACGVACLRDRR